MVNASTPWVVLNAIVNQDTSLMSRLISASIKMNVAKEVKLAVMRNTDMITNFVKISIFSFKNMSSKLLTQLHIQIWLDFACSSLFGNKSFSAGGRCAVLPRSRQSAKLQ